MALLKLIALSGIAGKRTYLLSLAFTAYALLGWYLGFLTIDAALNIVQTSGIGATLRAALPSPSGPQP